MAFSKLLCWPRNQYASPEPPYKPRIPVKRKRALTITIPIGRKKSQRTNDQLGSFFFRLPAEVRVMIYEYFFGQEKIDIYLSFRRLTTYPLYDRAFRRSWRRGWEMLALLRSCRRVYSEAIPFLYATPNFIFISPESLLIFMSSILPQRSIAITALTFNFPLSLLDSSSDTSSMRSFRMSPCTPRNHLPTTPLNPLTQRPNFWRMTCDVLKKLDRLRKLELRIDECSDKSQLTKAGLLMFWLEGLKGRVDMDVRLHQGFGRETWLWVVEKEEITWRCVAGREGITGIYASEERIGLEFISPIRR